LSSERNDPVTPLAMSDITGSHTTYEAISQALPFGVILVDSSGSICNANSHARTIFGYGEEITGLAVEELVPPHIRKHHVAYREGYHRKPSTRLMADADTLLGIRKDGSLIAIEVGLSPIYIDNLTYTVVSITDVTKQREFVKELENRQEIQNKLLDNLTASNQKMERFTYICSHDLQEPIRTAVSFSQLLKNQLADTLDEKSASYLRFIDENCSRALRLIQGLRDYERVNSESLPEERVCCHDLVERINNKIKANNPDCRLISNQLPTLKASSEQLNLLFTELIKNAFQFNRAELPTVELSADEDENSHIIAIKDNGIAINHEHRENIFDLFYRLDRHSNLQGEGIGLALCKAIAERNGATITIEDDPVYSKSFVIAWPK